MTSATFRLPGPLAIAVAQVDAMSRRARRARAGLRLVRGRARGLRHPVPRARRAVRPAHRAAGDHHRAVADAAGGAVLLRGHALHGGRLARAAQAGAAAAPAGDRRRPRREAHTRARRPVRRRVQRAVRRRGGGRRAVRAGGRGVPGDRPRPGRAGALGGADRSPSAATTPRSARRGADDRPGRRRPAGERAGRAPPAEVVDRLGQWREKTGITRIYLQLLDLADLDQVELIAAEVAPSSADPGASKPPSCPGARVGVA